MFDYLTIARALSDENRVRILMALRDRSLCVCQVTAFLDLAPSTTSKHLSILRQARLIEGRKRGRWVYYELAGDRATSLIRGALDWTRQHLERDASIVRDEERIAAIIRTEGVCGLDECAEGMHAPELHALDTLQVDEDVAENGGPRQHDDQSV